MKDMVVLVTGANAGLGYQLSCALARMQAHVVMACRNPERARQALDALLEEVSGARATTLTLDVSEPQSVRGFVDEFSERVGHVDVLIHNAGVFGLPPSTNSAGHELHLATNYLGPFLLTGLLLPAFRDAPGARVVSVGSLANRFGTLDIDAQGRPPARYSPWRAYAQSKASLLAYTFELDRRLRGRGSRIVAVGAHPGMAPTNIASNHSVANPRSLIGKWFTAQMEARIPSVVEAARPILHAACAAEVRGGEYFGPGGWLEIGGAPAPARVNARARPQGAGAQLWSTSERLTGFRYLS